MAVLAVKSATHCKLCKSAFRDTIDLLLERRSNRERDDETGANINFEYVKERVEQLDVVNLTPENVKVHWRQHCRVVQQETAENLDVAVAQAFQELGAEFADEGPLTADNYPDRMIRVHEIWMQRELAAGRGIPVTIDQVGKLIDTKTRRRHNEHVDALLAVQAGAITKALDLVPIAGEILEGEAEEVSDVESG